MNNHGSKSLSSYHTCKLVPSTSSRHASSHDEPQTATCCTALQRGFPSSGAASSHPRFAPLRTPGSSSSALTPQDQEEHYNPIQEEEEEEEDRQENGQQQQRMKKIITTTAAVAPTMTKKLATPRAMVRKMVRKCKSSVADVEVSRIAAGHAQDDGDTPRLRRSGAVRRDWSFEDLRSGGPHKAA